MLTSLLVFAGVAGAIYAVLCVYLFLQQDRILFYPGPNDPALLEEWRSHRVTISSEDHLLEGWWAENPASATSAVLIYFGGNAADVLYTANTARRFAARRTLVVNYRGYGQSPGQPSQAALYRDALAIYDYVVQTGAAIPTDIVVMGRSLGSGLATLLAAQRQVGGAILLTPYGSIAEVAASHYPMFPVRLLLRHPFDSTELAKQTDVPAIFIAAEHDRVIPPVHARRLFDQWSGPKSFHVLPGVGHNDLEWHPEYYELINAFLRKRIADGG